MRRALIGATGFVGGNLAAQAKFDSFYHSRNIDEIREQDFDLVVCAGAPAVKWYANREPESDWQSLQRLATALAQVEARHFCLISTVDVYPSPYGCDEDTPIDRERGQPYGRHRLWLEDQVRARFQRVSVLRLPGIFGPGLKKNVLYDLIHENQVDRIDPDATFQFYSIHRLWELIERTISLNIHLLNVATEPLSVGRIAREVFCRTLPPQPSAVSARYDFWTRHAHLFGSKGHYLQSADAVISDLHAFVASQRSNAP